MRGVDRLPAVARTGRGRRLRQQRQGEDLAQFGRHARTEPVDSKARQTRTVRTLDRVGDLAATEEHEHEEHDEEHDTATGRDAEQAAAEPVVEAEPRRDRELLHGDCQQAQHDQHGEEAEAIREVDGGRRWFGAHLCGGCGVGRTRQPARHVAAVPAGHDVGRDEDADPAHLPDQALEQAEHEEHAEHAERGRVDPPERLQRFHRASAAVLRRTLRNHRRIMPQNGRLGEWARLPLLSGALLATLPTMDHDEAMLAARAVTTLAARLAQDSHLAAELQRARREFFLDGTAAAASLPGAAAAAELRFQEWFTLERESEVLGAVPAAVPELGGEAADFVDSQAGLWLVEQVTTRTVEARDLQDGQAIDLHAPLGALEPGDLIVGRIYAEGAGRWTPSTAAAIYRPGNEIAQAFLRDMLRLGLERRLQQIELERLLLMRPTAPRASTPPAPALADSVPDQPLEHLEADLDRLLTAAGSEHSAAAISQQLALAVRPGQVLGPLLDELAFDTSVNLDAARELLLAIWNAHHRARSEDGDATAAERTAPGETLGERLVRTLDEGLAQKRDVEELFAQLERMAGIEPGEQDDESDRNDNEAGEDEAWRARGEADDEDDATAGADADGNLAALIEEYLWETGRTEDPAAADLRHFAQLPTNAALPHRDLEEITAADCMRLLLHVYLAALPTERALRVRSTFEQLLGFYQWAVEVQEMDIGTVLDGCRGGLVDQVERLQAASIALSTAASGRVRPGMLEVEELAKAGFGARDDDGGDHWIEAPQAAAHLRVGDLLLGALAPAAGPRASRSFTGLVVALPADARALME